MTEIPKTPLSLYVRSLLEKPGLSTNFDGDPFDGVAVILDDGSSSSGPLDAIIPKLDTFHGITPERLLLVLPGAWDEDLRERAVTYSFVSAAAQGMPENAGTELMGGDFASDYSERSRGVVRFRANDNAPKETRAFAVTGFPLLLANLGVSHAVVPSIAVLDRLGQTVGFVNGANRLSPYHFFSQLREEMGSGASPAEGARRVCAGVDKLVIEEMGILSGPLTDKWQAWHAHPVAAQGAKGDRPLG